MPTIASHQDLAAAAEPLLQQDGHGSATDARPDGEVGQGSGQGSHLYLAASCIIMALTLPVNLILRR